MENHFEWRDEFNIGVDVIDREHQRLFKIINKIVTLKEEEGNGQWACQEGVKFFKGHTVKHFADEEAYMASIQYGGLEQHRQIHRSFREHTLPALEQELERTGYAPDAVDHFLGVCAGWLIGHTLTEDQAITGEQVSKWEHLLPSEEVAALKKVIIQLVFDMFQLESQMVSDAYGGEKFGRGVYCRLVYGAVGEKRQEILMVFEEKLLINTVGKVLGLQTNKLDTMLVNAARYTVRQFVGRVMEHYPDGEDYELKEENLLTYGQFRKIFQREKPQVSLLFNTGGAGYFSYCVIAPHLLEQGESATPLEPENAMEEVEKYLAKREKKEAQEEANPRKKILVVDDSATIRQAMKKLLGEEYRVDMAESGVAAIRAITLNRPDLVLLDYEMPVCDGKQTLEMLRSEGAFADIPVIFLTGRSDPELVRTLLSLKPAGYLLKYLKPDDIKQKIGRFFETGRMTDRS